MSIEHLHHHILLLGMKPLSYIGVPPCAHELLLWAVNLMRYLCNLVYYPYVCLQQWKLWSWPHSYPLYLCNKLNPNLLDWDIVVST